MAPNPVLNVQIRPMQTDDVDALFAAFGGPDWNKPREQFERYWREHESGNRTVLVACVADEIAGYATIVWPSEYWPNIYPPFRDANIPEIKDLNVLAAHRAQGFGTALIGEAERLVAARGYESIGLGVGLSPDYGAAQRLYPQLGYVFDGRGTTQRSSGATLYLTKNLAVAPFLQAPILEGKFARLVPLERAHIPALWKAAQDPRIWEWFPFPIESQNDMAQLVERHLKAQNAGEAVPFTILEAHSGEVVGQTRLHAISQANQSLEIGKTWLNPRVWRGGINRECKFLLLSYCFETLGCVRVQLKTDARNARSQAAIEALGATREGILRDHWILPDGQRRSSVLYSLLEAEWPAAKARLQTRLYGEP